MRKRLAVLCAVLFCPTSLGAAETLNTQSRDSTAQAASSATAQQPAASSVDSGNASKAVWVLTWQDDYEDRAEIGDRYTTSRGHEEGWTVLGGVLVGKQTKEDHGAVIRTELDFDDVDIEFDFRFSGGKSFNFVIDDKNEKSVHAGHICRASVFPKYLRISDDKTGGMNLEVRRRRQDKGLSEEDAQALGMLLDRTRSSAKISIKQGKWHTLRIRIHGDVMKAFLDDDLVASLRSPGFDHPTKTKFGFTVNGSTIDFDNLSVRQLKPESRDADKERNSPAGPQPESSATPSTAGRRLSEETQRPVEQHR